MTRATFSDHREVAARVRAASSSFYWPLYLLPKVKRQAMFAVYAFCRDVDDIGDGGLSEDAKRQGLNDWRTRIHNLSAADTALTRALADATDLFDLPIDALAAVIDGVQMDLDQAVHRPTRDLLNTYCDRVAGAVGILCLTVFGAESTRIRAAAHACGRAVQQTNILRDINIDAAEGRLYLPAELLGAHGIHAEMPVQNLPRHAALPLIRDAFAADTRALYGQAREHLAHISPTARRPAKALLETYAALLDRITHAKPDPSQGRIRLGKVSKVWIAARYALTG